MHSPTYAEAAPVRTRIEESLDALDIETKKALGALHDAPSGVAELTIATLGYWPRVMLVEEGIIEPFEEEAGSGTAEAKERPSEVVITSYGREIMAASAARHEEEIGAKADAAALEGAHRDYLRARETGEDYHG